MQDAAPVLCRQTQGTCSLAHWAGAQELSKDLWFCFLNEYHVASFQIWQKCSWNREMQSGSLKTGKKNVPYEITAKIGH